MCLQDDGDFTLEEEALDHDDADQLGDEGPQYRAPEEIDMWELPRSLGRLALFSSDSYLSMQANNLGLIDRWLMDLERQVLVRLIQEDRTPMDDAMFLSALTQMWIFAAYEVLRTWRQRAKEVLKLVRNSGLQLKIDALEQELGYLHFGKMLRASQLREVQEDPALADKLEKDFRRVHIVFAQLEALRVAIAKHEVRGRPNMPALAPGYARIDHLTGSLKYEIGSGRYVMDFVSRRDLSDALRAIDHDNEPQTAEELASFDAFMKGPGDDLSPPEPSVTI